MTKITGEKEGEKLLVSTKSESFKKAMRDESIKKGDTLEARKSAWEIVKVFDGSNPDEYYEVKLQEKPYPVTYRRSVKQLSEQFGTDPKLGGVLMRKKNSNTFNFIPKDTSKDEKLEGKKISGKVK